MMRRTTLAGLVLLAAAHVASAQPRPGAQPAPAAAPPPAPAAASPSAASPARSLGLISGGVDGTYVRIAADMAAVLDDGTKLRIVPMLGKGSVQNIDDLLHLRGVDVAIVQSDVLAYIRSRKLIPGAERSIGYIAKLYDEELHILAAPGVADIRALAGRPVNIDVRGSGTALTASILFESLGIAIKPVNDDQTTALEKLRRGEIAAIAYVAGKPARLFASVDAPAGLHFVSVPLTPALLENYIPTRLTHLDYPALIENDASVDTVAVGAVLASFAWPPGTDGYRRLVSFVDAIFTNIARFRQPPRHPKWRDVSLAAQVPGWTRFSPAAERAKADQ